MNVEAKADARLNVDALLQRFNLECKKLYYPAHLPWFHRIFTRLARSGFFIQSEPWLAAFELAAIANRVCLYSASKLAKSQVVPINAPLNTYKLLWRVSELGGQYAEDPLLLATFMLRFVHQQMPFVVSPERATAAIFRMKAQMSWPDMQTYWEQKFGLTTSAFFEGAAKLYENCRVAERFDLRSLVQEQGYDESIRQVIECLAASRAKRLGFYKNYVEVTDASTKPYEINTLLRYPLADIRGEYYCPFPELISYAVTLGMFFRLSTEDGDAFRIPFARSMEWHSGLLLNNCLPEGRLLTEKYERDLGWKGKTNDVTFIVGRTALLFECKLSAIYLDSKQTAGTANLVSDIRKQVVGGLVQLHEKVKAIREGKLPSELKSEYSGVEKYYPILLFYDEVSFGNRPEVMGNIIRSEIEKEGIARFDYQLWHLEELYWLCKAAGGNLLAWIEEKFAGEKRSWDLKSFIAEKNRDYKFLTPIIAIPPGKTPAMTILEELVKRDAQDM